MYNPVPGVLSGVPADRGYEGGFVNALMAKDLKICMDVGEKIGAKLKFTELALELYYYDKNR